MQNAKCKIGAANWRITPVIPSKHRRCAPSKPQQSQQSQQLYDNKGRVQMLLGANFASAEGFVEGYRLHRAQ